MIDGVGHRAGAGAEGERNDPQQDARHGNEVGGQSGSPGPRRAGDHRTGTHGQQQPAQSFHDGGRNDAGFRETQRDTHVHEAR